MGCLRSMRNPFEKQDHTALILGIAAGALAAGTLACLYLTEGGREARNAIKVKLKGAAKELTTAYISYITGVKKETVKGVADHVAK